MVLAVKGENPDSCTYSFLSMAALVDTYKAKATGKDASTTVTIAGYEVDVKVNVSAAAGNALVLKDDGLYVPTPEEVDISGKADKVTGATTGNFAALDGEGNLTDSGKKPADFVGAEAGKRLMSDAEGEKLAGVSEGATKTAASSTNGNVNIDGKEVVVYTEPENVLHDEDVEDFSAEEIAALLADADKECRDEDDRYHRICNDLYTGKDFLYQRWSDCDRFSHGSDTGRYELYLIPVV